MRSLTVILIILSASTLAFAQSENLLKNPSGDEDAQHWRAFGNAKVENCLLGGPCFVLQNGGYFVQEVSVPEGTVGHYALLIGRVRGDRINATASVNARPALYGYMMNAGNSSGGRIYAYLSGQQMILEKGYEGQWIYRWGVFKVQPGTMRISIFLKHGGQKGTSDDGSQARFDDLGVFIFPTEHEALAYIAQRTLIVGFGSGSRVDAIPQCLYQRQSIPPLYGIRLGMSPDEVVSLFPESSTQTDAYRMAPNNTSHMRVLVENRKHDPELIGVRELYLKFRNGKLYSFAIFSSSPQWKNVDEFIDKRGHLLNLTGVNTWNPIDGNSQQSKYLICDGVEIRFYAAPSGSPNENYISVIDTAVEAEPFRTPKPTQRDQP